MCSAGPTTNKEELVKNAKVKGSHSCSEHETVKLKILREMSKTNSRITALDFRRVDFRLFTDLLGRIPWETGLEANKPKQAS